MSADRVRILNDGHVLFLCPGCGENHMINKTWTFNGDAVKPTIKPSILCRGKRLLTDEEIARVMEGETVELADTVCHSFVTDGKIQFLPDCTHALAGQTVELPPNPYTDDEAES